MYIEQSLKRYIEDLSAKLPAPGGGSASAACGALGVALVLMVSNFTIGKEAYATYEKDIKKIIAQAERFKKRLLEFIDSDVEAYKKLSKVYKIPKEERDPFLQDALKEALSVPLDICKTVYEAIKLTSPLLTKGNKNLISDIGIAASLLQSAFESANMNIDINLKDINDRAFVGKITEEITEMSGQVKRIAGMVISEVNEKLKLKISPSKPNI